MTACAALYTGRGVILACDSQTESLHQRRAARKMWGQPASDGWRFVGAGDADVILSLAAGTFDPGPVTSSSTGVAMRIVLDVQHAGKPDAPRDRGAPLGTRSEVWATRRLGLAMEETLDALGHDVFVLRDGSYADRHKRCDALNPDLYVALHFDSGIAARGDRGAVFFWPGSTRGQAFAERVATASAGVCPWPIKPTPATAPTWDRVRACLAGVKAPALLLELGFCDGSLGRSWLQDETSLRALGQAVARAVVS